MSDRTLGLGADGRLIENVIRVDHSSIHGGAGMQMVTIYVVEDSSGRTRTPPAPPERQEKRQEVTVQVELGCEERAGVVKSARMDLVGLQKGFEWAL
jgi:hypothetical protein